MSGILLDDFYNNYHKLCAKLGIPPEQIPAKDVIETGLFKALAPQFYVSLITAHLRKEFAPLLNVDVAVLREMLREMLGDVVPVIAAKLVEMLTAGPVPSERRNTQNLAEVVSYLKVIIQAPEGLVLQEPLNKLTQEFELEINPGGKKSPALDAFEKEYADYSNMQLEYMDIMVKELLRAADSLQEPAIKLENDVPEPTTPVQQDLVYQYVSVVRRGAISELKAKISALDFIKTVPVVDLLGTNNLEGHKYFELYRKLNDFISNTIDEFKILNKRVNDNIISMEDIKLAKNACEVLIANYDDLMSVLQGQELAAFKDNSELKYLYECAQQLQAMIATLYLEIGPLLDFYSGTRDDATFDTLRAYIEKDNTKTPDERAKLLADLDKVKSSRLEQRTLKEELQQATTPGDSASATATTFKSKKDLFATLVASTDKKSQAEMLIVTTLKLALSATQDQEKNRYPGRSIAKSFGFAYIDDSLRELRAKIFALVGPYILKGPHRDRDPGTELSQEYLDTVGRTSVPFQAHPSDMTHTPGTLGQLATNPGNAPNTGEPLTVTTGHHTASP